MSRKKGTDKMELVSVHIQKQALEELDELVRQGVFPSRSEAIRYAVRRFLAKEDALNKQNNDYSDAFMIGR